MHNSTATSTVAAQPHRFLDRLSLSLGKMGHTITKAEQLTRESGAITPPIEGVGLVATPTERSTESSRAVTSPAEAIRSE